MRIAIIGAGHVGIALGNRWAALGHEIVFGVRDPSRTRAGQRTSSVRDAVVACEVAVLATPWAAVGSAIESAGDFGGRVLIDVTNPISSGFTLAVGHTTSGAEQVASLAKTARVVKAFNTTGLENMVDPQYGHRRLAMPVAGDDAEAVAIAAKLAGELGFDAVPLQPLARARDLEPLAMLWIKLALQLGHGRQIGFGLARRTTSDTPTYARSKHPRTIVIVGTGNIGSALARAWLAAGHHVAVAVRDASAADVVELVSLGARAVAVAGSASAGDVVVFAVPAAAVIGIAQTMGDLGGKVVVDCTNAIAKGFTLQYGHTTSSSEELAKSLPGSRVVRSFNQQGAEILQNPIFDGLAATNFVASDDADARAIVVELARDAALDAVDVGPLTSSRYLEPMTLLWVAMAKVIGTRNFGLELLRRPS